MGTKRLQSSQPWTVHTDELAVIVSRAVDRRHRIWAWTTYSIFAGVLLGVVLSLSLAHGYAAPMCRQELHRLQSLSPQAYILEVLADSESNTGQSKADVLAIFGQGPPIVNPYVGARYVRYQDSGSWIRRGRFHVAPKIPPVSEQTGCVYQVGHAEPIVRGLGSFDLLSTLTNPLPTAIALSLTFATLGNWIIRWRTPLRSDPSIHQRIWDATPDDGIG
jgi:hypothetical protein